MSLGEPFNIEENTAPSRDGGRWYFKLNVRAANVKGGRVEHGPKSEPAMTR
jgi:hypothetical protein